MKIKGICRSFGSSAFLLCFALTACNSRTCTLEKMDLTGNWTVTESDFTETRSTIQLQNQDDPGVNTSEIRRFVESCAHHMEFDFRENNKLELITPRDTLQTTYSFSREDGELNFHTGYTRTGIEVVDCSHIILRESNSVLGYTATFHCKRKTTQK